MAEVGRDLVEKLRIAAHDLAEGGTECRAWGLLMIAAANEIDRLCSVAGAVSDGPDFAGIRTWIGELEYSLKNARAAADELSKVP